MLRDAKKESHIKDHIRGRRVNPKERDEHGRLIPQDKFSKLELLPSREKSRPYYTWREGGGLSWHAISRWLLSRVNKKLLLSEAPKEWRDEIKEHLKMGEVLDIARARTLP